MTWLEDGKNYWIKAKFLGELSERPCGPFIPEKRYAFRIGELKTPTCIDFSVKGFEAVEVIPESEKVTIPKEVADWIEECKNNKYHLSVSIQKGIDSSSQELSRWLFGKNNQDTFARAWLDGYEIEKEPLYWVRNKEGKSLLLRNQTTIVVSGGFDVNYQENHIEDYTFTEKEIKDYDERYFAFAVPVEEER